MNILLVGSVGFPESQNIAVNMMPFIMGDHNSIPDNLKQYTPLIDACDTEQVGKIGYLTITESTVKSNVSQRRGGIHTESPGKLFAFGGNSWGGNGWGGGYQEPIKKPKPKPKPKGGVYMASNVSDSCKVWDARVEIPGKLGDCEHLRDTLGDGQLLKCGELWWMTDKTPHESLPVPPGTNRQFFRLVTNQVSFWFSKHSTPNPLGILPDCPIIDVDKFSLQ